MPEPIYGLREFRMTVRRMEICSAQRPVTMDLRPEEYEGLRSDLKTMYPGVVKGDEPYMLVDGIDVFPSEKAPKRRRLV